MTVLICLVCGALIVGWVALFVSAKSGAAEYLGLALAGFIYGFVAAIVTFPVVETVFRLRGLPGGSFLQVPKVLVRILPEVWLTGGGVTGGLIGILLVQLTRRDRK